MDTNGRFSPAWAGNGATPRSDRLKWSVQPRVGGERHGVSVLDPPSDGSAPRGRGTDAIKGFKPVSQRFSPAWAGNGTLATSTCTPSTVQPRVGGERRLMFKERQGDRGSAPRGRGTEAA